MLVREYKALGSIARINGGGKGVRKEGEEKGRGANPLTLYLCTFPLYVLYSTTSLSPHICFFTIEEMSYFSDRYIIYNPVSS